ncbi:MAG: hypothetical protein U1F43_20715 [Myxococcota bacterium]
MRRVSMSLLVALGLALAAPSCGRGEKSEPPTPYREAESPPPGSGGAAAPPRKSPADFKAEEKRPESSEPVPSPTPSAAPAGAAYPTDGPVEAKPMDPAAAAATTPKAVVVTGAPATPGASVGYVGDGSGSGAAGGEVALGKTLAPEAPIVAANAQAVAGLLDSDAEKRGEANAEPTERPAGAFAAKIDEEDEGDDFGRDDDQKNDDAKLGAKGERARGRGFANRDGDMRVAANDVDPDRFTPPDRILPRMLYFENTYLGGSAAYAERLRRLDAALGEGERHYQRVKAEAQPFDAPASDGLAVTASVDATHIEDAQRVFLQVGIRGSDRYGWRRPPLDVVLVIDRDAFAGGPAVVTGFVVDLMRKLGSADRLGIVVAGDDSAFLELTRTQNAQQHLARRIDAMSAPTAAGDDALARAMRQAGAMLQAGSDDEAVVPGSETVLVLTSGDGDARVRAATAAAHDLTIQGAVTSIFTLDQADSQWWQVANAGYGNFHRVTADTFDRALDEEMADLARVVARLVRVNVHLGKDVDAIRVLGTRVLDAAEVTAVKAREAATDANLSKTMGIASDRGEDDDGIQTIIPYFYGDDSHVILIELWVKKPGLVADVTVRYKDMVNLDNATARTSVILGARPQQPTREQELIARNVRGFELGETLQHASIAVRHNDAGAAVQAINKARALAAETNQNDAEAVEGLLRQVEAPTWQNNPAAQSMVVESLLISGQRRVGDTENVKK